MLELIDIRKYKLINSKTSNKLYSLVCTSFSSTKWNCSWFTLVNVLSWLLICIRFIEVYWIIIINHEIFNYYCSVKYDAPVLPFPWSNKNSCNWTIEKEGKLENTVHDVNTDLKTPVKENWGNRCSNFFHILIIHQTFELFPESQNVSCTVKFASKWIGHTSSNK